MPYSQSRRRFIRNLGQTGGLLAGASLLPAFQPLSADETNLDPSVVRFHPDCESLVRVIEETPRQKLLEDIGGRVKSGLSYRELLAALFLAGIRNVQPRPSVGFKFHAVLVVNSAHIASQSGPDSDRWLPIFWALDEFKSSQARDTKEGNWTMSAVNESSIPTPEHTLAEFDKAMLAWDEDRADGAAAGLARHTGATQVLESFAKYCARDFRSIGHKAIYVANAWRTLQTIGWHHAEPVVRSLAYALLNHNGEPNPAENDLTPDRPWKQNQELAKTIRNGWQTGKLDSKATEQLLSVLRSGSPDDAAKTAVELLNANVSPQSVFDALHVGAGELLMRQPGIVALHAVTTTNAIRFLFDTTGDVETRKLLLLQNASFLPLFREGMQGRGKVGDGSVLNLQAGASEEISPELLPKIFADISSNRMQAANGVFAYLNAGHDPNDLLLEARRLIFLKGTNAHDYKFSSAALEDFHKISADWQNRYLATSVFNLRGSGDKDNGLVNRIRAAVS